MKVGKLLKIYMDINDVSCRELAKEIGISSATVSRIVNGKDVTGLSWMMLINWLCK